MTSAMTRAQAKSLLSELRTMATMAGERCHLIGNSEHALSISDGLAVLNVVLTKHSVSYSVKERVAAPRNRYNAPTELSPLDIDVSQLEVLSPILSKYIMFCIDAIGAPRACCARHIERSMCERKVNR